MDSYRPISLSSIIGKTMDCLVTNHLQYIAESMHLLTEYQAGIKHSRCTEDQLLRLSQSLSDGFQPSPMQRTVLALIDYSRAYDKVWKDALLKKMSQKGIPSHMVWRIQARLSNRLIWVTFDGVRSRTMTLKQGVPHGSVLSGLLFYIDDLVSAVGVLMLASSPTMLQCGRRTRTCSARHPNYRRDKIPHTTSNTNKDKVNYVIYFTSFKLRFFNHTFLQFCVVCLGC